jgi:hypothetical protein
VSMEALYHMAEMAKKLHRENAKKEREREG